MTRYFQRWEKISRRSLLLLAMASGGVAASVPASSTALPLLSRHALSERNREIYRARSTPPHPIWGDLSRLAPPRALNKALRIVGGPPDLGGEPWPRPNQSWSVTLAARLDEDGRPGDLLILPPYHRGQSQPIENVQVIVKNFRRVRLVGLHLRVSSMFYGERRQHFPSGRWLGPDGEYMNNNRMLNFHADVKYLRDAEDIFVEGCYLQVDNNRAGTEAFPYGDGIAAYGLGWHDAPLERFVIQNTRIGTMGTFNRDDHDNDARTVTHSDNFQLQARVLMKKLFMQNVDFSSNYQCLFFPRNSTDARIADPRFSPDGEPGHSIGRIDAEFYRMVLWSPAPTAEGTINTFMAPGGPRYGLDECHNLALLEDVYCGTPLGRKQWQAVVAPGRLYKNPTADAFTTRARYVAGSPVSGVVAMFRSRDEVPDFAPLSQIGLAYGSPWE